MADAPGDPGRTPPRPSSSDPADEGSPTDVSPRHLLRKSRDDRILTGVCGGLARYFGVDSTLVRLAFVLLTVAGGGGIIVYLVALLLMPDEDPGEPVAGPPPEGQVREGLWFFAGVALIALGLILLIGQLIPWFGRLLGPVLLIAIGVGLLVHVARR
jgi:phage shock protein C